MKLELDGGILVTEGVSATITDQLGIEYQIPPLRITGATEFMADLSSLRQGAYTLITKTRSGTFARKIVKISP